MSFKFIGSYLFDDDKRIGTIKDNETIKVIEDLLNGVDDMKKTYRLDFKHYIECEDIVDAAIMGQNFAKKIGVEFFGVNEVYIGDNCENEERDDR